jgi:hypothetical protein
MYEQIYNIISDALDKKNEPFQTITITYKKKIPISI